MLSKNEFDDESVLHTQRLVRPLRLPRQDRQPSEAVLSGPGLPFPSLEKMPGIAPDDAPPTKEPEFRNDEPSESPILSIAPAESVSLRPAPTPPMTGPEPNLNGSSSPLSIPARPVPVPEPTLPRAIRSDIPNPNRADRIQLPPAPMPKPKPKGPESGTSADGATPQPKPAAPETPIPSSTDDKRSAGDTAIVFSHEESSATPDDLINEAAASSVDSGGEMLIEPCPKCNTLMDVTDQAPFAKIYCPNCGQGLRARRRFDHYVLLEHIADGGMGSVYKALDYNLNRNVALKILKKEMSANEEERVRLASEAKITASINHPHIVKVFSFGEDHGLFYLAMELVEKGSLDQLMALQQRVPEAQVLSVGIQIAEGLEAALERGLIHRDIKPGNILFSDSQTAKLVDFGLAIIADEAASAKGEIWGTPYYIAPEKLDNQPEDFRSDIYSLGGTMFHALAGRPPYEAETASMVALKQLKSQTVSLQAFAPYVSSETNYVINRMIIKEPDGRYQSYRELIEHLIFARQKVMERSQRPPEPKQRVVLETQETKNFSALLSLGLLAALILIGVVLYVFREPIFKDLLPKNEVKSSQGALAGFNKDVERGVGLVASGKPAEAAEIFKRYADNPATTQPAKNWAIANQAIAQLAQGDRQKSSDLFARLETTSTDPNSRTDGDLANLFAETGRLLEIPKQAVLGGTATAFSKANFESFFLLAAGLHNWSLGDVANATPFLEKFAGSSVTGDYAWIAGYKPLAAMCLADRDALLPIMAEYAAAKNPAAAQAVMNKLRAVRPTLKSAAIIGPTLAAMEKSLQAKGAKP